MSNETSIFWAVIVVLIGCISYIVWVGKQHSRQELVFFYSYSDFALCSLNCIFTLLIFSFSAAFKQEFGQKIFFLPVVSFIGTYFFLFSIAYKANNKQLKPTIIVFLGQIFLSISFIAIWALSVLWAMAFRSRDKYERKSSYNKAATKHACGALLLAVTLLSELLCLNQEFKLPPKENEI